MERAMSGERRRVRGQALIRNVLQPRQLSPASFFAAPLCVSFGNGSAAEYIALQMRLLSFSDSGCSVIDTVSLFVRFSAKDVPP